MVRNRQDKQLVGRTHFLTEAVKMKLWNRVPDRGAASSTGGCDSYCII